MRSVIGVAEIAAIGQRHPLQQPGRPVLEAGQLRADRARGQALAQVVGQRCHDAVRIGDREWLAVRVVGVVGRGLAKRVGYRVDLTALVTGGAAVVRIGRDIRDICAGAIGRQHLAEAIVGIGSGARLARGRVEDRLRLDVAIRIVRECRAAARFVDLCWQAIGRMPLRTGLTLIRPHGRRVRIQVRRTREALHPNRLKIAAYVVRVARQVVVEIEDGQGVSVCIIGSSLVLGTTMTGFAFEGLSECSLAATLL